MSLFSFSLSHTLTMFLSISSHGLHLLKLKVSLVFLSQRPNGSLALALYFNSPHKAEWPLLLSFLFLQRVQHTYSALHHFSLREVRPSHACSALLQTKKLTLWGLRRQAHKWALTRVASKWVGPTRCQAPNILNSWYLLLSKSTWVLSL